MLAAKDRALKKYAKEEEERNNTIEVTKADSADNVDNMQNKIISYCCSDVILIQFNTLVTQLSWQGPSLSENFK